MALDNSLYFAVQNTKHKGLHLIALWTSQLELVVKNLPANAGDTGDVVKFNPGVLGRKISNSVFANIFMHLM